MRISDWSSDVCSSDLKARYAEALRVAELAAAAHMSPSALHQRFKAATTMSPLQFQKQLRLQEARRLMLSEGMEAAAAGHRVGYDSPSQFSREYRRLFGAPPRREVVAARVSWDDLVPDTIIYWDIRVPACTPPFPSPPRPPPLP